MENQNGLPKPRLVVLDIEKPLEQNNNDKRNKRHRHKRNNNVVSQPQNQILKYPLEMQPALNEVLEYGMRTYSLGLLKGAKAMDDLVEAIESLGPKAELEQLEHLISGIKNTTAEYRLFAKKVYEDDT